MNQRSLFAERRVYKVSELNAEIKALLETRLGGIWVEGEISNFKLHSSGHAYFTLKDKDSQLRAVCFKGSLRMVRFRPEDGLAVLVHGTITVYTPRGEYQILVNAMEPQGLGSLLLAFEQLKQRLEKEGLFDASRKKSLPLLPRKIGIITSPTGAVIRDMLHILKRRNSGLDVLLYPVRVQGEGATQEIASAVNYLSHRPDMDVIIVGRGGGSMEDLWAFNEEAVARAIAASPIPIISAVGHETDFTIADFVADLRAPTPSAAAELVSGAREELQLRLSSCLKRIRKAIFFFLSDRSRQLQLLSRSRAFHLIEERIRFLDQRLDELAVRSLSAWNQRLAGDRHRWQQLQHRLEQQNPRQRLLRQQAQVRLFYTRLQHAALQKVEIYRGRFAALAGRLETLSPLGSLGRGYAICRNDRGQVLREAAKSFPGDFVQVKLFRGQLGCRVEEIGD